ncbi:MAG TPA: DsbA family protein [Stellaceae bacterium]|nr:DsbA family protein [Stellaceae bacterium]
MESRNVLAAPQRPAKLAWVWYDFLCPFCYAGQERSAYLVKRGFQIVNLPFQIHAGLPPEGVPVGNRDGPIYALLEREIRAAGLPLRWPTRLPNTRRALAVAEWTRRHMPSAFQRLHAGLFAAHFAFGEDLGDPAIVDRHATSAGVRLGAVRAAFADGSALKALEQSEAAARRHRIRGAPAWLIGDHVISGLQRRGEFEHAANAYDLAASYLDPLSSTLLRPLTRA